MANYKCTFGLKKSKGTSVMRVPSQREQYEGTVHLFIGTGRSPGKITSMPSNTCLQVIKTNKVYLVLFPSLLGLGQSY